MLSHRLFVVFLGGLLAFTGGCAKAKAVKALVTLDGKPVEGATVVLTSTGGGVAISGFTGADGTATLDSADKKGVPPGDYKVVVTKVKAMASVPDMKDPEAMKKAMMSKTGAAPKSELPAKYGNAATTPATLKIPADSDPAKIELKSAP
jgi:hypothetical protein